MKRIWILTAVFAFGAFYFLRLHDSSFELKNPPVLPTRLLKSKSVAVESPSGRDHQVASAVGRSDGAILLDEKLPMASRLAAWNRLNAAMPESIGLLIDVAMAEHKVVLAEERSQIREEAIRIMALQSLEKALLAGEMTADQMKTVVSGATSETVRAIAQRISEATQNGDSYFAQMEKAVASEALPH